MPRVPSTIGMTIIGTAAITPAIAVEIFPLATPSIPLTAMIPMAMAFAKVPVRSSYIESKAELKGLASPLGPDVILATALLKAGRSMVVNADIGSAFM